MGGGREDDGIPAVQKTNANPPGFQTALFSPFPRRPARRVGTAERALVGFADDSAPEPLGRARGAMAAAVAYHERDFDYDEHVAEVLATRPAPGSEARDAEPAPGDDASARTPEAQRSAWDRFHAAHARGAFFKPRRYLLAAFPALAAAPCGASESEVRLTPRKKVGRDDASAIEVMTDREFVAISSFRGGGDGQRQRARNRSTAR